MITRRQRRVSELLFRELRLLLLYDVKDPRLSGVIVTGVDVTQDLLLARVYFSLQDDEVEEREALDALGHAKGYLRTQLADRVQLRFVPDLAFEVDKSVAHGQRIDEILDQLRESGQLGDEEESV